MDVRLARPTDAMLVLGLALDDSAHLVKGAGWPSVNPVAKTMIRSASPVVTHGRTWIAREGSSGSLLEAMPRRYVIGWDIVRLAARGETDRVLDAVVSATTEYLQNRGVPRLFARCREDVSEYLKSIAFYPLAREYVLVGRGGTAPGSSLPVDSRYRMPQDAWPLHQLESAATPTLVRHMEGLTSLDWAHRIPRMHEIVVEKDGRVAGWVGWGARLSPGVEQIGLIVHPDCTDLACPLLQHALAGAETGTRFVARVRDYHPEVVNAFMDAGFQAAAEEILMVKHARVALAPLPKSRIAVATVPGMQAFRHHTPAPAAGLPGRMTRAQ